MRRHKTIPSKIIRVRNMHLKARSARQINFHTVWSHWRSVIPFSVDQPAPFLIGQIQPHRQSPLDLMVKQSPCRRLRKKLCGQLRHDFQRFVILNAHHLKQPLANIGTVIKSVRHITQHFLCALAGGKVLQIKSLHGPPPK